MTTLYLFFFLLTREDNEYIQSEMSSYSDEFHSGLFPLRSVCFVPLVPPLVCSGLGRGSGSGGPVQQRGTAGITKVKDYLHMVYLTREREILRQDSSLM